MKIRQKGLYAGSKFVLIQQKNRRSQRKTRQSAVQAAGNHTFCTLIASEKCIRPFHTLFHREKPVCFRIRLMCDGEVPFFGKMPTNALLAGGIYIDKEDLIGFLRAVIPWQSQRQAAGKICVDPVAPEHFERGLVSCSDGAVLTQIFRSRPGQKLLADPEIV